MVHDHVGIVLLTPATLIGVCSSPDMLCNMVMKPLLMLLGGVIMVAGLTSTGIAWRKPEQFA